MYQSSSSTPKMPAKVSAVWRPPSVSSYDLGSSNQPTNTASSYYQPSLVNNSSNNNSLIGTVPSSANRANASPYYAEPSRPPQNQYQNQTIQPSPVSMHSPVSYSQYQPQQQPLSPHMSMQSPTTPSSYIKPYQTSNFYSSGGGYDASYTQPLTIQPIQAAPPAPPPPPPAYIPPPPPPMNSSSYSSQPAKSWNTNANSNSNSSNSAANSGNQGNQGNQGNSGSIPDALLKSMHGSGKKPFTYTPGGLDLSHVKNSQRVKRHEQQQQQNISSSTQQQQFQHQQQHQQQRQTFNQQQQQQQQSYSNYASQNSHVTSTSSNFSSPPSQAWVMPTKNELFLYSISIEWCRIYHNLLVSRKSKM